MIPSTHRKAFPIYFGLSAGLALVFLLATFLIGKDYTIVERIGGALWILFLSLIITMVVVIPRVKAREMEGH
jgi:hypothetical protein